MQCWSCCCRGSSGCCWDSRGDCGIPRGQLPARLPGLSAHESGLALVLALLPLPQLPGGGGLWSLPLSLLLPPAMLLPAASRPSGSDTGASSGMPALPGSPCALMGGGQARRDHSAKDNGSNRRQSAGASPAGAQDAGTCKPKLLARAEREGKAAPWL